MDSNVTIKIDALDQTKGAFSSVEKSLSGISKKIESLQPTFQTMSLAGGVALAAVSAGANKAIESASNLGESINAVNVVFGKGAKDILSFGESASTSVGMSNVAFNQMATITGALLKDTGKPLEEVAALTTDLATRAADMASVFNTDVNDAMSAINQAIRGETEAIRRYAGDVTDASLQTYLYSQGIDKNVTSLTEQEKRLYRVQLIMQQTQVTAGDFSNTSDSLANRQRILAADIENVSAKLGGQLLPIMQDVLNKVSPLVSKLSEWIGKNPTLARDIIIVTAAVAGLVAVVGALGLVVAVLMSPVTLIIGGLALLAASVYAVVYRWNELPGALKLVLYPIKIVIEHLKFLYDAFMWVGSGLSQFLGIASAAAGSTSTQVGNLQSMVDGLIDPMAGQSRMVESFGGAITGLGSKASETADKIKALKEEAAGIFDDVGAGEANSKKQLAEAIVEQEESISEKKRELKRLEKADDSDSNASRIRELRNTIREEEASLRGSRDLKLQLRAEIDEAERRAALSDFERKIEDIQTERVLRLEAQLVRLQEIEQEIAAERSKSSAIAGAFGAAQTTMQSAIEKTREVAETEAERMKKAFDRAISSMNQLSGGKLGAGTLWSSVSSKISGRAKGGPVSGSTPYIVGEVGPELFVPGTSGRIVPNDQLATAGGSPIYVTITGNSFMGERDMAEKIGDQLTNILKFNGRL